MTAIPKLRDDGKMILSKIHFQSPGGAVLDFDRDGFSMPTEGVSVKHGAILYHDVTINDHWGDDHAKIKVSLTSVVYVSSSRLPLRMRGRSCMSHGLCDIVYVREDVANWFKSYFRFR